MIEDEDRQAGHPAPAANENNMGAAARRIDAAVLRLARLIGRQMARETFARLTAANDNHPTED